MCKKSITVLNYACNNFTHALHRVKKQFEGEKKISSCDKWLLGIWVPGSRGVLVDYQFRAATELLT